MTQNPRCRRRECGATCFEHAIDPTWLGVFRFCGVCSLLTGCCLLGTRVLYPSFGLNKARLCCLCCMCSLAQEEEADEEEEAEDESEFGDEDEEEDDEDDDDFADMSREDLTELWGVLRRLGWFSLLQDAFSTVMFSNVLAYVRRRYVVCVRIRT